MTQDKKNTTATAENAAGHKPVLKQIYQEKILPELQKARGYKNPHQVPGLVKIVLNSAFKADADKGHQAEVVKEISKLAGQKAVVTKARKSISNFKVRQGMPLGVMVTLRGANMYEFLFRLTSIALPMIRDFRGVSNKLDGNGNYSLGIADHTIFPETQVDGGQRQNIGLDITIVTSAESDDEGRELLRLLGIPFRKATAATPVVQK
ncbi:MAG: 50S ribosomal protein L5 [Puniceicoccales bacterium]|jgi:large subunit ribosomal protein L5|nr:50S ribosomal protein L5 [Puniceicoccales bacterium]